MPNSSWQLRSTRLSFDRLPAIMGIVNVTPDSFSDGGKWFDPGHAVDHALQLVHDGAAILDIGGESTRPYSQPVDTADELKRVIPVIEKIASQTNTPISIDTSKSIVARAAIDAGAEIINDITGLSGDPKMVDVAVASGAGICAMHIRGTPQTMQDNPQYENVVENIFEHLKLRKQQLLDAGVRLEKICLDPGIGFGKTHQHNIKLVRNCQRFHDLGTPILVGHSRKGFIRKLIDGTRRGRDEEQVSAGRKEIDLDAGSLAVSLYLAQQKIQVIRVHEVARTVSALKIWSEITQP